MDSGGNITSSYDQVVNGFVQLYTNLLGTNIIMEPMDPHIVAFDPVLREDVIINLVGAVTNSKIKEANCG